MKRKAGIIVAAILFLGVTAFSGIPFVGPSNANACACMYDKGAPGGGDFTPQQPESTDSYYNKRPALTKEQAYNVIADHIKKFSPGMEIGEITDAGNYYEAKIVTSEKEVVERLAVDKKTGGIMVIN